MTNEQWNTTLYKQMFAEQEQFRDWLLAQPPQEILNHAYEYVMREDILLSLEYNDLTDAQAAALLSSSSPLADVYAEFDKLESSHMEEIWSCIESRADALQAGLLERAKTLIDEFCAYEYASQADFRPTPPWAMRISRCKSMWILKVTRSSGSWTAGLWTPGSTACSTS